MSATEDDIPRDQQPVNSVAEIDLAVQRGEVTFPMVMKALYLQWESRVSEAHIRDRYRELYKPALSQFVKAHGGIAESFYADEFAAGALLTKADVLYFDIWWDEFKFQTIPARALEADINDLRLKALLYLAENHRRICMQRLFRLYKALISSLRLEYYRWSKISDIEDRNEPHKEHIADLEQIGRELEGVEKTYQSVGHARGQARYVIGAVLGAVAIVMMAGIAVAMTNGISFVVADLETAEPAVAITEGLGTSAPGPDTTKKAAAMTEAVDYATWFGALAAGAIGALLSVLQRLTKGALRVRFEAERLNMIILSGISRPVVGSLTGVALLVLVEGGIVPFEVEPTNRGLFFAGLAFLTGFSERFAKDVLGNAASTLSTRQ